MRLRLFMFFYNSFFVKFDISLNYIRKNYEFLRLEGDPEYFVLRVQWILILEVFLVMETNYNL